MVPHRELSHNNRKQKISQIQNIVYDRRSFGLDSSGVVCGDLDQKIYQMIFISYYVAPDHRVGRLFSSGRNVGRYIQKKRATKRVAPRVFYHEPCTTNH